jgi:hypothetical protein
MISEDDCCPRGDIGIACSECKFWNSVLIMCDYVEDYGEEEEAFD